MPFQLDLRHAARQVWRRPTLVAGVVVTLSLGVFGTTALARAVLETAFRSPPGATVEGLYSITVYDRRTDTRVSQVGLSTVADLRRQMSAVVETIAADAGTWQATLENAHREGEFAIGQVDGYYATALNLRPQAGRWFGPEDDRLGSTVVVISESLRDLWFAGRPDSAVGAPLRINGRPFTIIGIADRDFAGLTPGLTVPAAWVPITAGRTLSPDPPGLAMGLIKPRPNVSAGELEARVQALSRPTGQSIERFGVVPLAAALRDGAGVNKALLLAAMAVILWLTACSSVANLFLARAAERRTEIAVRLSLGATRRSIVRLFSAEALVIATVAAGVGALLTSGVWWIFRSQAAGLAGVGEVTVLGWLTWLLPSIAMTLVSTIVVAAVTTRLLANATPLALLASGNGSVAGSRAISRVRVVLVAFQVAVGLQAALGAGLYVERLADIRLQAPIPTEDEFDSHLLATARVDLVGAGYNAERASQFMQNLLDGLRRLPGVQEAAVSSGLPTSEPGRLYVSVRSAPAASQMPFMEIFATPSFFRTTGIPLIQGASFPAPTRSDPAPVAVVSESGARVLWPGERAVVGRKVFLPRFNRDLRRLEDDELTVIGVTADSVRLSPTSPPWAANVLFVPLDNNQEKVIKLILTRSTDPAAQVEPIRRTVRALDPVLALAGASARENHEQLRLAALNRVDGAMVIVSALAVATSTIGVYGLMSFFASARRGELAVRVALGASPASIAGMMIRQAVRIVLFGLLPGVFVASVLSRVLQAHVLDFMPNDVRTWSAALLLILVSGIAASYLPARRAASSDPALTLRQL